MKKTLLIGSALMIAVAGYSQSNAKKAVNPKYLQKSARMGKIAVEPKPSATTGMKVDRKSKPNKPATACNSTFFGSEGFMQSFNCFGVGGGIGTSNQNCLTYNSDLNSLLWTQRGSPLWSLNATSGCLNATIINASTLAIDTVVTYADPTGSVISARYPSGTFINAIGNTNYHNAIAVSIGQITNGTNWTGTAYAAKPLESMSAVGHSNPTHDSLYVAAAVGNLFGNCAGANLTGSPANDLQALSDGKTAVSVGSIADLGYTATDAISSYGATFVKAISSGSANGSGTVTWTTDSTSLKPNVYVGSQGFLLSDPRMAFGPDGMTGYVVFTGVLATPAGNTSDSCMTPILYKTTDGGNTWTQKLAGYNWMCNHPEVNKNVGLLVDTASTYKNRYYSFDEDAGVDLTVDANGVLHYVSGVIGNIVKSGIIDSIAVYGPVYNYDNVNYHPLIWDFMTDGTYWNTMFVDSLQSAACGAGGTSDSTTAYSAMGGTEVLAVTSHITVSRSQDGSKIFYGWADSDPNATGVPFNIQPDIYMKAYDVSSQMLTATKNTTGGIGVCFYPYLSDISYYDGSEWVVPAVYTTGNVITATSPQITYDASSQANYFYSNCGTFANSEFTTNPSIFMAPTTGCSTAWLNVKTVTNTFASSISNFPNPFSNTTTIAVTLTESKTVDIKIYNAIGTIVSSQRINGTAGQNNVNFDGGQLSAGVYYYTVTAGNDQATKKMVIQK